MSFFKPPRGEEELPRWREMIQDILNGTRSFNPFVSFVKWDTANGPTSFPQGVTGWDSGNHTLSTGLEFGSVLQHGMEVLKYAHNETGADIANGVFVFFDGTDAEDVLTIDLVDASTNARHAGLTTSPFGDDGYGYVVKDGTARDVSISGLTLGLPAYADPTNPGGLTNTLPEWADYIIFLGAVTKDNGDGTGDIEVSPYIVQREVPTLVSLETYSAIPARNALENVHGGISIVVAGHDLSAGDLTLTGATAQGIGKLVIVVNAGSDVVGEITVTGTTTNRDTGIDSTGQTNTLAIDTLSTDSTSLDANGVVKHDLVDAYITSDWFNGNANVVISSADTTITDIDVYQCSFEQYNGSRVILLQSLDINVLCTTSGGGAAISAYLYTVLVTGDKVAVQTVADIVKSDFVTGRYYRLRRGALGLQLDGRNDGVFVENAYLGSPSKFADAGIKVWAKVLE